MKSQKSIGILSLGLVISIAVFTSCENSRDFEAGGQSKKAERPQTTTPTTQRTPEPTPEPQYNGQTQQPPMMPPPILMPPPVLPPPIVQPPINIPPIVAPPTTLPPSIPNTPITPPPVSPQDTPEPNTPYQPFSIPEGPKYESGSLQIPITPVANMEKGYQATNPGFRAVLKNSAGQIIAAGPMTVEAAMNGVKTPSAPGNAYPRLVLNVELKYRAGAATSGSGTMKICLADDPATPMDQDINCKQTGCYDKDRPCGYTGRPVQYTVQGDTVKIDRWEQSVGDADSPTQAALSAYHAAKDSPFVPTAAWEEPQSPLVLDLNRDKKIELVSFHDNKVAFDLNGDGKKTITGWVAPTDGLLTLDLNGNGQIDSGRELFGEYSALISGKSIGKTFEDGFTALAQYDSNLDQTIDKNDKIFSSLKVWNDKNLNGKTEKGELISLASAGIKSISLFFERAANDNFANMHNDNDIRLIGEYTTLDHQNFSIVDVWFRYAFGSQMVAK